MGEINLTEQEIRLARSAFTFLIDELEDEISSHGTLTKWARAETRNALIGLRAKFPSKQEKPKC